MYLYGFIRTHGYAGAAACALVIENRVTGFLLAADRIERADLDAGCAAGTGVVDRIGDQALADASGAALVLDVRDGEECPIEEIILPLTPLRSLIRDYFRVCEAYYEAIKTASPSRIEAIDMGRRGIHNEGAEILQRRLAPKIEMDEQTSRRLFTLICVLHVRDWRE